MMAGVVNADREAMLRLVVVGPNGQRREIETIIDTGFTGFLTFAPEMRTGHQSPTYHHFTIRVSKGVYRVHPEAILERRRARGLI